MTKINKKKPQSLENSFTEFLLYKTPNNQVKVEIFLRDENIWLTQEKIAALFGVDRSVITKHLKNIFETAELKEDSVCAKFAHTAEDGKNYQTKFYNLDAIISVGYRVNSMQATNFRIWANQILKEYIIKGFAMDDERLKDPRKIFGKDYFDEQLEKRCQATFKKKGARLLLKATFKTKKYFFPSHSHEKGARKGARLLFRLRKRCQATF